MWHMFGSRVGAASGHRKKLAFENSAGRPQVSEVHRLTCAFSCLPRLRLRKTLASKQMRPWIPVGFLGDQTNCCPTQLLPAHPLTDLNPINCPAPTFHLVPVHCSHFSSHMDWFSHFIRRRYLLPVSGSAHNFFSHSKLGPWGSWGWLGTSGMFPSSRRGTVRQEGGPLRSTDL